PSAIAVVLLARSAFPLRRKPRAGRPRQAVPAYLHTSRDVTPVEIAQQPLTNQRLPRIMCLSPLSPFSSHRRIEWWRGRQLIAGRGTTQSGGNDRARAEQPRDRDDNPADDRDEPDQLEDDDPEDRRQIGVRHVSHRAAPGVEPEADAGSRRDVAEPPEER